MASTGQFNLSPAGYVIGLDFKAALEIAKIRGYNLPCVLDLLQDAEPTIISLLNEKT